MRDFLDLFISRNRRWRITHSILYKLVTGCISLIILAACFGTMIVLYFMLKN
jgi:hypothetical protein